MSVASRSDLFYWEHLWNAIRTAGWHLAHYSYTDSGTGGMRHLLVARKDESEFVCSAGNMDLVTKLIFREIQKYNHGGN